MFFGCFWGDWTIIILIPALIFTFWAQLSVQSAYSKYSRIRNAHGMTGADAARRILDANGLHDVKIEQIPGEMTDHYDPRERVIRLSQGTHSVATVAAVGIAAHEAGHAVQHAVGYHGIRVRNAILPACRIGSAAAMTYVAALATSLLTLLRLLVLASGRRR